MLEFFRSLMKSKIGVALLLAFLGIIAFAFVAGDMANLGGVGSVNAGDKVATAGDRTVSASEVERTTRSALESMRQKDPGQSMKSFIAGGNLDKVLDSLIDNAAVAAFGQRHGLVAGDRLVDSELLKVPNFRGTNGNFDANVFRSVIQREGYTEASFRQLIADELISNQVLRPASLGGRVPQETANRYAAIASESREGAIALLPAAVFIPKGEPSAAELTKYYTAHADAYIRPEHRTIRYAVFDEAVMKSAPAPTDAEVAARYNAAKASYAASETRKLTQLIVPTEAAAKAIIGELGGGKSFDAVARGKGLLPQAIAAITKEAYLTQSSAAVADAVFSASQGSNVGPLKGGLGWHIVHIDGITRNSGKTLDQARDEIVALLSADKKRAAFADFSARIEEEFDGGGSLSDVAKELGVTLKDSSPLTADGKVFGKPEQSAPAELLRAMQAAFAVDKEGQPQLNELVPGKTFLMYDVAAIAPSAPAPIAEIRAQVMADYLLEKGAAAAKIAALKVEAAAKKGTDLSAAMAALGVPLPPVDQVIMRRAELRSPGKAVPPPLALMFAMAKGTVKVLPAPNNRGYYVVALKSITPGQVDPKDPRLAELRKGLSFAASREYLDQLRTAIRNEVGVKKNAAAISALSKLLTGGN